MSQTLIRMSTAKLISKLIYPLTDSGLVSIVEFKEVSAQLKHLASKGDLLPVVEPRLMNTKEVATSLGIGVSNLKKLLREERINIPKRYIGSSVRFRSTDVMRFIMSDDTI